MPIGLNLGLQMGLFPSRAARDSSIIQSSAILADFDFVNPSSMTQARDGIGAPPGANDVVGWVSSPQGVVLSASDDAWRPRWLSTGVLKWEFVDDNLSLIVPAGGWAGTLITQTVLGVTACGFALNEGAYDLHGRPDRMPSDEWRRLIFVDAVVTQEQAQEYLGDATAYGSVTVFDNFWANRSEIRSFPAIDTAAATRMAATFFACTNMTSYEPMDFGNMQIIANTFNSCALSSIPFMTFPSATNMNGTWRGNSELVDVPAGMFDDCPCTNCPNIFGNCGLSQQSVDNMLVSFDAAGTFSGTLGISGGTNSPPSAVGLAAKASLEGRGWTVSVNA